MSEKKVLLELRGVKTFFPVRGGFFNKVRYLLNCISFGNGKFIGI